MLRWNSVRPRFPAALLLGALAVWLALLPPALPVAHAAVTSPVEVLLQGMDPGRLAVADLRGHALAVVDPADRRLLRRVELPGGPHELVLLPDGRIAASLEQAGMIAVVDPASGVLETVEVGGLPHGLAVSGAVLFVTDRAVDAVRRFSIDGWAELPELPAGRTPHALSLAPCFGGCGPSAVGGSSPLAVVNAGDSTLTVGGHVIAVSELPETVATGAGGRVAVAGALGGALEVFSPGGEREGVYDLGGRPVRVVFDPAGERIAVALSAVGTVVLVDPPEAHSPEQRLRRIAVGGVPEGLAFSADGRWLFVSDLLSGALSAVDVASGRVVRLLDAAVSGGSVLALP